MPSRSRTPCSKCRVELIPVGSGGLCEACRKVKASQDNKHYNSNMRDQEAQAFYNSGRWRRIRNAKIRQDPLCEVCRSEGFVKPADLVHHVVERKDGGTDDLENLQSVCTGHHEAAHRRFEGRG